MLSNTKIRRLSGLKYWFTVIIMMVLALYFAGYPAAAPVYETQESLQQAIKQHLQQKFAGQYDLTITVARLDNRLRLQKCQGPLHVFAPGTRPTLGATNLGVRCTTPAWKVHVPVNVKAYTDVLVARHPIPRGEAITKDKLTFMRHDVGRYHTGVFLNVDDLDGMIARRTIRDKAVITAQMIKPRRLISRGEVITIIAEINGLKIRTAGEALMDGHQGQIIRVKNSRSGRKLSGEVIARSTVRVKM